MTIARALSMAVILVAALDATQQTPPRFRSGVEAVTVDALVTSRGRPIGGLRADDFELLDNGVPQQIRLLGVDVVPLDFVLALDLSESVVGERFRSLLQACRHVIDAMRTIDRAAILTFSNEILERTPLTADRHRLLEAITGGLEAGGDTSLYDATYVACSSPRVVTVELSCCCSVTVSTRRAGWSRRRCWTPPRDPTWSFTRWPPARSRCRSWNA